MLVSVVGFSCMPITVVSSNILKLILVTEIQDGRYPQFVFDGNLVERCVWCLITSRLDYNNSLFYILLLPLKILQNYSVFRFGCNSEYAFSSFCTTP